MDLRELVNELMATEEEQVSVKAASEDTVSVDDLLAKIDEVLSKEASENSEPQKEENKAEEQADVESKEGVEKQAAEQSVEEDKESAKAEPNEEDELAKLASEYLDDMMLKAAAKGSKVAKGLKGLLEKLYGSRVVGWMREHPISTLGIGAGLGAAATGGGLIGYYKGVIEPQEIAKRRAAFYYGLMYNPYFRG